MRKPVANHLTGAENNLQPCRVWRRSSKSDRVWASKGFRPFQTLTAFPRDHVTHWKIASSTHRGKVRQLNEDALVVREDYPLLAVADGMGGHEAGDVASELLADALRGLGLPASLDDAVDSVDKAILDGNRRLLDYASERAGGKVVGSTVLVMLAAERRGACLWAGDSRLYRARHGRLEQLTEDHSYVAELVRSGHLSEAGARDHPSSNIITRAVGTGPDLELDRVDFDIADGDAFLLCTDGLYQEVDQGEILAGMLAEDPEAGAARLQALCLERAARDNITLVLARR